MKSLPRLILSAMFLAHGGDYAFSETNVNGSASPSDRMVGASYQSPQSADDCLSCDAGDSRMPHTEWTTHPIGFCSDKLLKFILPSENCFDDFISPMSNPVFFEDPRSVTEVRMIFIHHRLPDSLGGNSIQAYAPQFRLRLTERLSFIATKGSVIYTQSPVVESGFLDLATGVKYALYRDYERGRLVSIGSTFESPIGSKKSRQGNGDGEFHFFVTGGSRVGTSGHWLSMFGYRLPIDRSAENQILHLSNHVDYRLATDSRFYAFTEFNWYHYLTDGKAFPIPLEGGDVFNFGARGVAGNDLVTQAVGLKAKPTARSEAGIAYEFPLTDREGILANRLTIDLILRY